VFSRSLKTVTFFQLSCSGSNEQLKAIALKSSVLELGNAKRCSERKGRKAMTSEANFFEEAPKGHYKSLRRMLAEKLKKGGASNFFISQQQC
jgi:hypothetical protein